MEINELKEMKEKIEQGKSLNNDDIESLKEDNLIPTTPEANDLNVSSNSMETGEEKGKSYVKKLSGVPLFSYEEEENQKSGFSSALLLAIISFVSEVLFLALAFFIYR